MTDTIKALIECLAKESREHMAQCFMDGAKKGMELMQDKLTALHEENRELRAALTLMLSSHDASCKGEECQICGVDLARAVLAKYGENPQK